MEEGIVVFSSTDILSPNMYDVFSTFTPNILSVYLIAMIASTAILAATSSDP